MILTFGEVCSRGETLLYAEAVLILCAVRAINEGAVDGVEHLACGGLATQWPLSAMVAPLQLLVTLVEEETNEKTRY